MVVVLLGGCLVFLQKKIRGGKKEKRGGVNCAWSCKSNTQSNITVSIDQDWK